MADYGGFEYDSDYYGDDLPFWMKVRKTDGSVVPHLVVPYTLDTNDMRFSLPQGFAQAEDFFVYLRDSFDALYAEGDDRAQDDEHRHALPPARAARAASWRCSASWTMCRSTTGSGSAAASTSRATGSRSTLIKADRWP